MTGNLNYKTGTVPCPVCRSGQLMDFFQTAGMPVHVCVLFDSRKEALSAPKGDIVLTYCRSCGFIFNRAYDPQRIHFEPGYEASLMYSETFKAYIRALAERLIKKYNLFGKTVLEIGSGAGDFLRLLCGSGKMSGIGIDPTVRHEGTEAAGGGNIRFIRSYFSDRHTDIQCDFICCLSVFEDIPDPINFLRSVHNLAENSSGCALYFEVPNSARTFAKQSTWSIYYEQHSHFTKETLASTFARSGFDVLDTGGCYADDQYVYVEAVPNKGPRTDYIATAGLNSLPKDIEGFARSHLHEVSLWTHRLAGMMRAGKRIAAWGTGGKGIGFLNALDTEGIIPYAVDINPDRQDRFIPGSAQRVVPPEFLRQFKPDTVIITNPLYAREIKNQVAELGISPEFHVLD
jgi:SAM-dependent methyltransferase